jgi:hypothetical protein
VQAALKGFTSLRLETGRELQDYLYMGVWAMLRSADGAPLFLGVVFETITNAAFVKAI